MHVRGREDDVGRKFEGESTEVAEFFRKTRMIESNVVVDQKSWNPKCRQPKQCVEPAKCRRQ